MAVCIMKEPAFVPGSLFCFPNNVYSVAQKGMIETIWLINDAYLFDCFLQRKKVS